MEHSQISDFRQQLEARLHEVLALPDVPKRFRESISYLVFPGGKRIRPALCASVLIDLRTDPSLSLNFGMSVELLHTASLIHDDLPALDNDDERRGRATLHRAFEESTAVLAGDYLTSLALYVAAGSTVESISCVKLLSDAFCRVCDGQYRDLHVAADENDDTMLERFDRKTGALFEAVFQAGVILSERSNLVTQAAECGRSFGRLFQIANDHIDAFGSAQLRGRTRSSDQENARSTAFSGEDIAKGKERYQRAEADFLVNLRHLEVSAGAPFECTRQTAAAALPSLAL